MTAKQFAAMVTIGALLMVPSGAAHGIEAEDVSIWDIPEIVGEPGIENDCHDDAGGKAKATALRVKIGLASDKATVRRSFNTPAHICTALGVPLTVTEAETFLTFLNAQAELSDIATSLSAHPRFAGAYLEGDRLTILSTDGQVGAAVRSRRGSIRLVAADFTQAALDDIADDLAQKVQKGLLSRPGIDVTYVSVDPRANRVIVGVSEDLATAIARFRADYGDAVTVQLMQPTPDGGTLACLSISDCGTKGGLAINKSGVQCTSGFLVRAKKNLGTWNRYMLTAGHCIRDTGGVNSTVNWQNPAGTVTWGRNRAQSFWPEECGWFTLCWDNDLGLFGIGAGAPSSWNSYFRSSTTIVPINGAKTRANQLIGEGVWRSGRATGLTFSKILDKPSVISYSKWGYTRKVSGSVKTDDVAANGDSGAGYYRAYTSSGTTMRDAYGILSDGPTDGSYVLYFAWNTYFDDYTNDVCDVWVVEPCKSTNCPLT